MQMIATLERFTEEGNKLLDLSPPETGIRDGQLAEFMVNNRRSDFLRDLVGRVATLVHCIHNIHHLTREHKRRREQIENLPRDPTRPYVTPIPREIVEEEDHWLKNVDIQTSYIYYETASVVSMIRQLGISIDGSPELLYLVKVRDRFLFHGQLTGVKGGVNRGLIIPLDNPQRILERSHVALDSWSRDELRALGTRALEVGSPEWTALRQQNEHMILSKTHNEKFTQDQIIDLMVAGVRECKLELALTELGLILNTSALPIIVEESDRAVQEFKCERDL
jgi:hypothetical protein